MQLKRFADRHMQDAPGLVDPDVSQAVEVVIHVGDEFAGHASVQHTAWMAVNILARLAKIVSRVTICCPQDVQLHPNVIPFGTTSPMLDSGLVEAGNAIGIVEVFDDETGRGQSAEGAIHLRVGPGGPVVKGWRVHGEAWWGGIGASGIVPGALTALDSVLPFGPHVAACLAANEVFRKVRVDLSRHEPADDVFYSAWTHQLAAEPPLDAGPEIGQVSLDVGLAGAGAVGMAWLHTIWACPGLVGQVVAADDDTVDLSNLNRTPLLTTANIGEPKVQAAAARFEDHPVTLVPHESRFEQIASRKRPRFVVSAVDTSQARRAVQALYPYPLLFASTLGLRAEVIRCDPEGNTPCMGCFNRPDPAPSDQRLARRFAAASDREKRRLAQLAGITVEQAASWADDPAGQCGQAGERVLPVLRDIDSHDERLFAVPFVSIFAGVVLAAETIKETLGERSDGPGALSRRHPRTVMTFLSPTAPTNGAGSYGRDPRCPQCAPGSTHRRIWERSARTSGALPSSDDTGVARPQTNMGG